MNDNFMHNEIGESVCSNADANEEQVKQIIIVRSEPHEYHGRNGENDEEPIVLFKKSFSRLMMIFMQVPEQSVHHKAVRDPREAFHEKKCSDGD